MLNLSDEDLLDSVDAMVFSGDALHDRESFEQMQVFMHRWKSELETIEALLIEKEWKDTYEY